MITLFVLLILSGIILLVCSLIEIGSAVFWIFVFVCGVAAMFVEMYMDSRPAKRAPADKEFWEPVKIDDDMKVSVITPVYDVKAEYLNKCIDSILTQTYRNLELILVDDGAKGDLPKLLDEYALRDDRIRVIHQANGGASSARNAGLDSAKGEYVTFVDSDDWIDEDMVTRAVERLEKNDLDILLWGSFKVYEDKNGRQRLEKYMPYEADIEFFDEDRKKELMLKTMTGVHPVFKEPATSFGSGSCCSKLYKLAFLNKNELRYPVGIKRAEDVNFNIRAFDKAGRIGYLNAHFYYYRQHAASATYLYRPGGIQVFTDALNELGKFIDSKKGDPLFEQVYYMRCMFFFLESMDMDYINKANKAPRRERIGSMKEALQNEPYKSATQKLEYSNLSFAKKIPLFLMKHGMIGALMSMYKLYRKV